MKSVFLSFLLGVAAVLTASGADAATERVGVFGRDGLPIVSRLERNASALTFEVARATVTLCTRDVITRLFGELHVDYALCADGDAVSVWRREGARIVLKNVVVSQDADDRGEEVAAARAV